MVAATGPEAIGRGEYDWVLGELHAGANTLNQATFMLSHPDPVRAQALADDTAGGGPWLIPIYHSRWPEVTSRGYPPPYLISPALSYLQMAAEPPREGMTGTVVAMGDLTLVRDADCTLWLDQDGGPRRPAMALFGEFLIDGVPELFSPLAPAPHRPRISIDRLVLAREQWRMPVEETLPWAGTLDEPTRYRAARRWATSLRLPRHVFIRVTGERKPFYADLTSPLLINMIASTLRATGREHPGTAVTITEMYPDPARTWLPLTPDGRSCTSELRVAVVDRPTD